MGIEVVGYFLSFLSVDYVISLDLSLSSQFSVSFEGWFDVRYQRGDIEALTWPYYFTFYLFRTLHKKQE
jgi:hypothetical protein